MPFTPVVLNLKYVRQKFCHEAVIWKRLSHPNLLPFLGVNQKLFPLAMISEWMEHGTILQFVKRNPAANRLKLVSTPCSREWLVIDHLPRSYTTLLPGWITFMTCHLSIRTSRVWVPNRSLRVNHSLTVSTGKYFD